MEHNVDRVKDKEKDDAKSPSLKVTEQLSKEESAKDDVKSPSLKVTQQLAKEGSEKDGPAENASLGNFWVSFVVRQTCLLICWLRVLSL